MNLFCFHKKQFNIVLLLLASVILVVSVFLFRGKDVVEVSDNAVEACVISDALQMEEVLIYPENSFSKEDIEISLMANAWFMDDSAAIYYTLDGSTPTLESYCYTEPIKVTAEAELQVVVIRASLLKDGVMQEPITRTYFVGENVDSRYTTKVVSIVTDEENLYDYETGIFVPGKVYDDWLAAGGNPEAEDHTKDGNYKQRTDDWIRDAHVEVFSQQGTKLVDIDAGISVAGSASASYPIKSVNIKADEKFDEQTMYFNFVEDGSEIAGELFFHVGSETNSVRLRNSGNDLYSTLIRQNICNELALQSGLMTTSVVTPVVVYLNGEYYSLLQAQNNFSSSNLGKMLSLETDYVVKAGETESQIFSALSDKIDFTQADFTESEVREEFERLVDIDEFFLYNALQIMIDNGDWPNNNYKVMYYTGEPLEGNPYSDGRLHFLFFGTDFAFQLYSDKTPMFEVLFNPNLPEEQKRDTEYLIMKMMAYEPYKRAFVNQICDLLATSFKPENVVSLFDKYLEQIEEELPYLEQAEEEVLREVAVNLEENVSNTRVRTSERIQFIYPAYLSEYFGASEPYQVTIDSPDESGEILCNTVVIDDKVKGSFEGTYYRNYPIKISAKAKPGYQFTHFLINSEEYADSDFMVTADLIVEDKLHVEACFEEIAGTSPVISSVSAQGDMDWIEITNPYINAIDLGDFYLTDDKEKPRKSKCPSVIIEQGETVRIVGRRNPNIREYRVSFGLKEMENIYLSDNHGEIKDSYFIRRGE